MCRALDITGVRVSGECERLAGRGGAKASDRRRPGTAGQGRTCAGRAQPASTAQPAQPRTSRGRP